MSSKLSQIIFSGFTPDGGNDKDADSKIKFSVYCDYGGGFVQTIGESDYNAYVRFPDGEKWGPIPIAAKGTFTIDNVAKVKGKLDFQPRGDDTWKFTYEMALVFDDGTQISKSGTGEVSDQVRSADL